MSNSNTFPTNYNIDPNTGDYRNFTRISELIAELETVKKNYGDLIVTCKETMVGYHNTVLVYTARTKGYDEGNGFYRYIERSSNSAAPKEIICVLAYE